MRGAGPDRLGRFSCRMAALFAPEYMARHYLAQLAKRPFIDPRAILIHENLELGPQAYIADRVVMYRAAEGGAIRIGARAHLLRDSVFETGEGGEIHIGARTWLHPRAQVMAYKGSIHIGERCTIAPGCAFYAYDHGMAADEDVKFQPLRSKGGIRIANGAWLGTGVIVLDGVHIGEGAVIGAGSVVTRDVPELAIAVGNPARVVRYRGGGVERVSQSGSRR